MVSDVHHHHQVLILVIDYIINVSLCSQRCKFDAQRPWTHLVDCGTVPVVGGNGIRSSDYSMDYRETVKIKRREAVKSLTDRPEPYKSLRICYCHR